MELFDLFNAVNNNDLLNLQEVLMANPELNINEPLIGSMTALHVAAEKGYSSCSRILIASGADVDSVDEYGQTALMNAVSAGHSLVAVQLLRARCDCNRVTCSAATSALHIASQAGGDPHILQTLLVFGAEPTRRDVSGHTPLSLAIHAASTNAVQAHTLGCIYENADSLARTPRFPDPLWLALNAANFVIAASLILAGYHGSAELRAYFAQLPNLDERVLTPHERGGYRFVYTNAFTVPSLQHLCRLTLRHQLCGIRASGTIWTAVAQLGLPKSISDYICFRDVYIPPNATSGQQMCVQYDNFSTMHF